MAALTLYSLHDTHYIIHDDLLLQDRVPQKCKACLPRTLRMFSLRSLSWLILL